jgi:hypothetical protein
MTRRTDEYLDLDDYPDTSFTHGALRGITNVLLLASLAFIASPAIRDILCRVRRRNPQARTEPSIDDALNETFPASDPPASRYVDIPVNRR